MTNTTKKEINVSPLAIMFAIYRGIELNHRVSPFRHDETALITVTVITNQQLILKIWKCVCSCQTPDGTFGQKPKPNSQTMRSKCAPRNFRKTLSLRQIKI